MQRGERAVAVLRTPDGKKLLAYLEDTYQRRKLFSENAERMAYNCGQFDLVEDIKQLMGGVGNE